MCRYFILLELEWKDSSINKTDTTINSKIKHMCWYF